MNVESGINVTAVTKEYINRIWPIVEKLLSPAQKYNNGRYSIKNVYDGIMNDQYQLWVAYEPIDGDAEIYAAIVTQIIKYPTGKKTCNIFFVGGNDMKKWIADANNTIEKWAKDCGCTAIEGSGRRGWIKALERFGGKTSAILLEREI